MIVGIPRAECLKWNRPEKKFPNFSYLSLLLRLGRCAKRKEHGAKSKSRDYFSSSFFASIPLALGTRLLSLDHPIRSEQHRLRNRQVERFRGLQIDDKFKLRRLLNR